MMTTPETMKAYGATDTVDPIVHNDIAGWSFMVEHDAIDAHTMSERQRWASVDGISVSRQVSERIEDTLDGWLSYGDNAAAIY